jgi:sulfite reductase (NADPH) flavoprotein alpha-component
MNSTSVRSVCPYCGVGCGIVMSVADNRVIKVSGDKQHPANAGRLCTKGSTCAQAIAAPGRMEAAFVRHDRQHEPVQVGIDEAISSTARRLRAIIDEHGPDALALYVSGQMSLEAQYLANKLAKGFVRTRHIESNSRLCMASAGSGYKLSLGADGPPGSYDDFDHADVFFVIGANMADCHPILFLRLLDRRKAGARLIVVDPRRSATADKADLFLQIAPGSDLALLNGLLYLLVENGHVDADFIARYTDGWEAMLAFVQAYTPARVAAITGLAEADIRTAAQWIGAAGEWMSCWTMGLNQSTHGTWNTNALCNLHLATGAICRPGSGPFSLTGQPNAMGGREMGYMGPGLPGQRSNQVAGDRAFIEQLWQLPAGQLRSEAGAGTVAMFEAMAAGSIKACWIICTNPVASVANRQQVIDALRTAELVITQDAYLDTETNRYADVLLPGALWAEAEGVMINSERNLTLMPKAVAAPGEAMADWQIIARIACAMGYAEGFSYSSAEQVFEEIKGACNPATGYDIRGASYARLREAPQQWPCAPGSTSPRAPIRYLEGGLTATPGDDDFCSEGACPRRGGSSTETSQDDFFGGKPPRYTERGPAVRFATANGRAQFFARPHMPPAELPDDDYPLVLNTGRLQHQWHTLTKTGKIATLNKLNPGPFIELHPDDAQALAIGEGDQVQVRSRRGVAVLPARITDRVRPGNCFAPFHWNDVFGEQWAINAVTSDAVDPLSLQPEFKYAAVALQRVSSPLIATLELPANPANPLELPMVEDSLARLLGLQPLELPVLNAQEQLYVQGFLLGLQSDAGRRQAGVPTLPDSAPLLASQRMLINGLLAGIYSRAATGGAGGPLVTGQTDTQQAQALEEAAAQRSSTAAGPAAQWVLWASQTGNAEAVAERVVTQLRDAGHVVRSAAMGEVSLSDLNDAASLLLVASTFGDGDAPDNGAALWAALQGESGHDFAQWRYAVLALGDSSYDQFCGFGRQLDERLHSLGAQRLLARVECEPDYDEPANAWLASVCSALEYSHAGVGQDDLFVGKPPRYMGAIAPSGSEGARPRKMLQPPQPSAPLYSKQRPYKARLLHNHLLNSPGALKETRHIAFDLTDSGFEYQAGDALGVWPSNCLTLVEDLLGTLRLDSGQAVAIKDQGDVPLAVALQKHLDICRITPDWLQIVAQRSNSALLGELLAPEHKARLKEWLWGRQLVDLLHEFPIEIDATQLLGLLKPLQPRLYSISSSPKVTPHEVHLTVSTVRYRCNERARSGVCSGFMADRAQQALVPIFTQRSAHFRVPADPHAPMIMVGPGTGVAPFRAFLQERQAIGAPGKNWLLFGEQRQASDFYYRDELLAWQRDGHLQRLDTAFSRDQQAKVYVQQRLLEQGAQVWQWLEEGGHFYVCGDASAMARDVDAALRQVVAEHGGMSAEQAQAYVQGLSNAKRYVRDVY